MSFCIIFHSVLAGAQQIAVTPPPPVNFGNIKLGSSQTQTLAVTNVSTGKVGITQASVTGTGYTIQGPSLPVVLTPGQSSSFYVTFAPPSAGTDSGTVSFVSQPWSGNKKLQSPSTTPVSLSGTGVIGQLASSPASENFGSVFLGTSQTLSATLTNVGTANTNISQVTVSNAVYVVNGLAPPLSLTPGQSWTFSVAFTPVAAGATSGSLTITSDASNNPFSIALSGSGVTPGQLQLTPSSYNFGNVNTGTSAGMNGTLAASGSSITISSASSSNSQFALSGITLPLTLASGQSAPFTVTFLPQNSGTVSGSISFVSNATNPPTTESLTGSGVTSTHSVGLSWSNSSTGTVGYNVYRSGVSGGPYTAVTTSPDPNLSYSDTTVSAGQTYYYVVTSVNSIGVESGYSNEAQAVVPSP